MITGNVGLYNSAPRKKKIVKTPCVWGKGGAPSQPQLWRGSPPFKGCEIHCQCYIKARGKSPFTLIPLVLHPNKGMKGIFLVFHG